MMAPVTIRAAAAIVVIMMIMAMLIVRAPVVIAPVIMTAPPFVVAPATAVPVVTVIVAIANLQFDCRHQRDLPMREPQQEPPATSKAQGSQTSALTCRFPFINGPRMGR